MEDLGHTLVIDPDTLCPVTGVVCPDRKLTVKLYNLQVHRESIIPVPDIVGRDNDRSKMYYELNKQEQDARRLGCQSNIDGVCVTEADWQARLKDESAQQQHLSPISIGQVLSHELLHAHL